MAAAAVVFDLDGTVWDSHRWFAEVLSAGDAEARANALAQLRAARPAATLLREGGITRARFRKLCEGPARVALYPGAESTITTFAERGVVLGVATNLPGWMAGPMLACTGIDSAFSSVVTYERTRKRKPHPEPLLLACEEMAVEPGPDVWYVGDSASDRCAATAAALSFGWARWGYAADEPANCDARLDRFEDVLGL